MKAVAVDDVNGMIEKVPGIRDESGIGLVKHLTEVEAARGKADDGLGVGPRVVAAPGTQRRLLGRPLEGLA